MHNILRFLFPIVFLFSLTACFEVIEEVNLHADGSGEVSFTFNASQSKVKLKSVMLMDSINGYKVPSVQDIEKEIRETKAILSQQSGISQVAVTMDHASFIYSLSMHFSDVNALNRALNTLAKSRMERYPNAPDFVPFDNYAYDGQVFTRLEPEEDRSRDYYQAKAEDREVIDQAQLIAIYRFDQSVVKTSNPQAKVSPSGKAVMLRSNATDLILKRNSFYNEITLN